MTKTFMQRVTEREAAKKNTTPPPPAPTHTTPNDNYTRAALDREIADLAATASGNRNHALNVAALKLAGLPIDRNLLRDHLLNACHTNGLIGDDGLGATQATIDSAFRKADADGPRTIPERTPPANYTLTETIPAAITDENLNFTPGGNFILDIPDTIPALWGDGDDVLWAEGESLMIAGPMGLGKTTLAGQLIRAQLGLEDTVLGLPVATRTKKILYLAMDRPAQIARAMGRQFGDQHRAILNQKLTIWKGPPPADIAKQPTLLNYLAEMADADTIYVDSLKDAALGLSEDEVGAGYNRARQHVLANGRQLAELHHTVKRSATGGAPNHVADIYGSAWLTNGTGSIILLGGEPGDPIVSFKHPRQPANEVGPWQLLHDQAAGTITVHHSTDLIDMVNNSGAEGLTAKGAAAALFDAERPTKGQIEKARRKLEKLAEAGLIVECEGARGRGNSASASWFPAVSQP